MAEHAMKRGMANAMQWGGYLALASAFTLLWLPLARYVNASFKYVFPQDPFFEGNLWAWMALTGLLTALAYRGLTSRRKGNEPKPWAFACLFPAIAVLAHVVVHMGLGIIPSSVFGFLVYMAFGTPVAYIYFGWLIIPLAIPQTMLLGFAHRRLKAFPDHATQRHYRHALWTVGCVGLLGLTEVPRVYDRIAHGPSRLVLAHTELTLPPDSRFLRAIPEEYGPSSYWFGVSKEVDWPLHADQRVLTEPDERESMHMRAVEAEVPVDGDTEFRQVTWNRGEGSVRATLVRTGKGDYVEVTPW